MAQRRMIDKKISISEQVSKLPLDGQFFFTWCIPHADDIGLLPFSPGTLKAMVVPRVKELTEERIGELTALLEQLGLLEVFSWEGEKFYRVVKFLSLQTLKKDRNPVTLAKNIETWEDVDSLGFQMESNGFPKIREEKLSEPPLSPPQRFSPEDGLEMWNRLTSWRNNKNPLERLKNKESIKQSGLLKRCNGITDQIKLHWNKKRITRDDWRTAVNKYIYDIINRSPTNDYCNHRFSMLEFVKQENGFTKFLNR